MNRLEYLLNQKQSHGRRIFGVFPAQYPKEILWAHNILPAEIWDPPPADEAARIHLQPYICSVVHRGLELLLSGKADFLDGLLFPHTCDSIQNTASMVNDYLDLNIPCRFFQHPKAPYRDSSRKYYLAQLKNLDSVLTQEFGPPPKGELEKRVEQGRVISDLLREIYGLRETGQLGLSNLDFYEHVRRGEYMWPDDYLLELESLLAGKQEVGEPGRTGLVLSGVLPGPAGLLELLDHLGVEIVGDDLLSCSRRFLSQPRYRINHPLPSLAQDYFSLPPCTTKGSPLSERLDYLTDLVRAGRARGIIFNVVKFCEPELFDLPNLRAGLRERKIDSLVVETEVREPLSGALATRVEAFLEMLG